MMSHHFTKNLVHIPGLISQLNYMISQDISLQ